MHLISEKEVFHPTPLVSKVDQLKLAFAKGLKLIIFKKIEEFQRFDKYVDESSLALN
jgi:diaminopimelate decarboxylase